MMRYLFLFLWAALQILFILSFLSSFLKVQSNRDDILWLAIVAWLLTAVFGLFDAQGIRGYAVYLLSAVLILLAVFGEYGPKGLCLLALLFLIPYFTDVAVLHLTAGIRGLPLYLAVTCGKALPVVLSVALRRLFSSAKSEDTSDRDMLLLRQHMEMQQENMNALEQNYRVQRKSAHEFEHHIQVIRDLLDRDEVGAVREYVDSLKKSRSICVYSVNSNHPIIDVILNQKYQTALENDIKMQIRVNDLSGLTIPTDSLVVVLTNLLDNAIEACRRIDGYREIIGCIVMNDGLYLSIRNTSEAVKIVDGKIPTSKRDSLSHGFGLMSVTYVLDKLGAEYTFGYEDGWFSFAAEIE